MTAWCNNGLFLKKGRNSAAGSLESGGRLDKKDGLSRYGDSHVKDKTS